MRRRSCRDGNHAFGAETSVGGGLRRNRCKYCGAITIDLRSRADAPAGGAGEAAGIGGQDGPRPGLFGRGSRVTIFDIEHVVSAGLLEPDDAD